MRAARRPGCPRAGGRREALRQTDCGRAVGRLGAPPERRAVL